ncbi:MAG TPA: CoA-binding protein [Parapedobacter sp.]|uniref:CoA-binding protein n=1 Tax=Parapedobacter sp. TaxID=1958893 RepID=UPI002C3AEC3A|nr:CoA-binding protein [Parapedobacter sp.]HWK57328.1 CoA-binding protein [Parapedobacter sp.]
MGKKKTLILGATTNPGRYAYLAAHRLVAAGHDIVNIGIKKGESAGWKYNMQGMLLRVSIR